jgi:hypothetical protein
VQQHFETKRRPVVRPIQDLPASMCLALGLAVTVAVSGGLIGCSTSNDSSPDASTTGTGGATTGKGGTTGAATGTGGTTGGSGSGGAIGAGTGGAIGAGTGGAAAVDAGADRSGAGGVGATTGAGGGAGRADAGTPGTGGGSAGASGNAMSFFVSSDTSTTANLGGLTGADARCQRLATAVGRGGVTWHAYLSTTTVNARDRIGTGPWYNSNGVMVAADLTTLHARTGNQTIFITEGRAMINGQYTGSPGPLQHDILTGTQRDGTISPGNTCGDWTATTGASEVGHSDGLGPNMDTTGSLSFWNAAHTAQCGNTAPQGGAGRIYCFAIN